MQEKISNIEEARRAYDEALERANKVLHTEPVDLNEYNTAISALETAEKAYTSFASNAMYDEYAKRENPVVEIVKAYTFTVLGHQEEKDPDDDNRIVAVNSVEKKRSIDLLKFCERAKLPTAWALTASKTNYLICLRAAQELGVDTKKIATTYFMQQKVRAISLGETPTSNTQVCKLLQHVIDEMLPNVGENGKPIYKVNNYDVKFLDDLYCKWNNKSPSSVKVSNDSVFRRLLLNIVYRLVTNGKYDVTGYKVTKPQK